MKEFGAKTRLDIRTFLDWAEEEIANGRADGDGDAESEENAKRIARGFTALRRIYGGAP